jgi:hypothetical protein
MNGMIGVGRFISDYEYSHHVEIAAPIPFIPSIPVLLQS